MDEAPLNDLELWFAERLEEVLALRHTDDPLPTANADPQILVDSLLAVRTRLDRIEGILAAVERARGRVDRALTLTSFSGDVAWAQALEDLKRKPTRSNSDFQGPRERYAEADLAALGPRRETNQLEALAKSARTAATVTRDAARGLNGVREDHLAILRAMNIGTRLEN